MKLLGKANSQTPLTNEEYLYYDSIKQKEEIVSLIDSMKLNGYEVLNPYISYIQDDTEQRPSDKFPTYESFKQALDKVKIDEVSKIGYDSYEQNDEVFFTINLGANVVNISRPIKKNEMSL